MLLPKTLKNSLNGSVCELKSSQSEIQNREIMFCEINKNYVIFCPFSVFVFASIEAQDALWNI